MAESADKRVTVLDQVNHAFFPKRLPDGEEVNLPAIEQQLLQRLTRVADNVSQSLSLARTRGTLASWEKVQTTPSKLQFVLLHLKDEESVCVYVRKQNCTVYFTQLDSEHIRIITIQPSLPNDYISQTCGSLEVTYPQTVDIVPKSELLLSECFSDQLEHLINTRCEMAMPKRDKAGMAHVETNEPSSSCIISELLVSLLCPVDSSRFGGMGQFENIKIKKKLRDQVNWKSKCNPFRRSGLWTSAKVVVALSLNEEFTNRRDANILYKILMLEFILDIAKELFKNPNDKTEWDLAAQIIVKLARRSKKLTLLQKTKNAQLEGLRHQTLQKVFQTVEDIEFKLNREWNHTVFKTNHGLSVNPIRRTSDEWEQDSIHTMDKLASYLNSPRVSKESHQSADHLEMIDPVAEMFWVTLENLLRSSKCEVKSNEDLHLNVRSTWIYQVEWFVREKLGDSHPPEKIYDLLQIYAGNVANLNNSDPVAYSKMVVTILKIVSVLDAIAVREHPILAKFETGITGKMFEKMLIPEKCEMELVQQLVSYFEERNSKATENDWLEAGQKSGNRFAHYFAEKSKSMENLKNKITADMELRIVAKKLEVDRVRKQCEEYQEKIAKIPNHTKWWNERRSRYQHVRKWQCELCNLKSAYDKARISVAPYQKPLPPTKFTQNVVVYELMIPKELAILRDSVLLLLEDVLGEDKVGTNGSTRKISKDWVNFTGVSEYKSGSESFANLCHLGSHTDDTLSSHYGRLNPDIFSDYSSFVIENGLTCTYYRANDHGNSREVQSFSAPVSPFTFKIGHTVEKDRKLYESLQFALDTVPPTENQVIASQYKCHKKLSLREFKAFGSLRCANLVQLRNLYVEVASKVLSLDKEPVVQLVMQTLWELGSKRENHGDFELEENQPFVEAFLEILRVTCEENATNWSSPNIFLTLIVITVRILVLSGDNADIIKNKASRLLQRFRKVLDEWSQKLEDLVSRTAVQSEVTVLMEAQLKCALAMVFTFNVETQQDINWVVRNSSDVTHYLNGLSRLHHLVVRENILTEKPPSKFISNLIRHARVTIPFNLHSFLHDMRNKASLQDGLHDFVCGKWLGARNAVEVPLFQNSKTLSKKHAFQATYETKKSCHEICVDILRGTFFVDGFPPSVLPESVVRNPLFKTFFKTSQFRVQRDSQGFKTVDKYRGLQFQFLEVGSTLIIRQMGDNNEYFELLPKNILQERVPNDLIEKYTHWYSSESKAVYFRHSSYSDNEENIEEDTRYLFVPVTENPTRIGKEWHLINYDGPSVPPVYNLLSILSPGFREITNNLGRLEKRDFIHVQLSKIDKKVTGKLRRLELSFTCNPENGLLYCNNYPEFYIPASNAGGQSLGTLVGLKSGVVLEKETNAEMTGKKKMFIVPHGVVSIQHGSGAPHQEVEISPVRHGNPVYFVYNVDQILNRLKPGNSKSAWLYLALLHGTTSSPFPDPFTQLTGTEMAMWILQSGFSWSCSPYDKECTKILEQIAGLSPKYKYYPVHLKNTQITEWPAGLERNSYAAYDGYGLVVQKLTSDSARLEGLFGASATKIDKSNLILSWKLYKRHINMYNKAAHLTPELVPELEFKAETHSVPIFSTKRSPELLTLAKYRHSRGPAPTKETVESLIMTKEKLPVAQEDFLTEEYITNWLKKDSFPLRPSWMTLYAIAQGQDCGENEWYLSNELTLIYGCLLYTGNASLDQLLHLHNIENFEGFPDAVETPTEEPFTPLDNDYVQMEIAQMIKIQADSPPGDDDFEDEEEHMEAVRKHIKDMNTQSEASAVALKKYWPTENISSTDINEAIWTGDLLNTDARLRMAINSRMSEWYHNRSLKNFTAAVDKKMRELTSQADDREVYARQCPSYMEFKFSEDNVDHWLISETFFDSVSNSSGGNPVKDISSTGRLISLMGNCAEQRKTWQRFVSNFTESLKTNVVGDCALKKSLQRAGIHQRLAPVVILRDHLLTNECVYIGVLAVLWANLKRLNRLMTYSTDPNKYSIELQAESETFGCENWSSLENPEWLLLELELDITIRPVQVEVARQMMQMPGNKNGVMQLNMGEGKTSVIIPMIVSTLSSRKDVLCRVTVLNSIFATNFNLLGGTIGGLLNKRLYTVPCNRDMNIGSSIDKIAETYKECMQLGGTVITLPEHRLSFRLQIYNSILLENCEAGEKIYETEEWLRRNARDLVDESDEVFSVKYQLIYTTGKQQKLDGGNMRWTVCQKLLELVPEVATKLLEKYGTKVVEFQPEEAETNPEQFKHLRILSDDCKETFSELMVEGILEGKVNFLGMILKEKERNLVKDFLLDENISEERHEEFLKFLKSSNLSVDEQQMLLLVSGYLRRGVLFASLKKRWRVEYGVKKSKVGQCEKLTAVPFRAKDVAAERTEFGHPDMAIVLTQLSYFYSGLSDEDLQDCFNILDNSTTAPETVYNSWIKKIPLENIKSDTVKTYQGINLQDYQQRRDFLFPILRFHTSVINFWLEHVAFPRECRQFPGKLVTNAFDLCYENSSHAATGFSGTNDTSLLLPVQITQQDLKSLYETNAKMEETLERPENMWKRSLEMGAGCKVVISHMIQDGARVLIDSGALMLELGNEKIAHLWLELDKTLEAVVYFNDKGQLVVKVRSIDGERKKMRDTLFPLSPYKDTLEKCAIYLDDQHTRGTDIKMPTNFKACVTVGSGMRRDKLIQACMRMRKLGKGQSVYFYLSHEVHNKIIKRKMPKVGMITVSDIIDWTKFNSAQFEKDGLVYWATNAVKYSKNLAADELFELSGKCDEDWKQLALWCEDPDAQLIERMYGSYHHKILVTKLVRHWFSGILQKLSLSSSRTELPVQIRKRLTEMENIVVGKCETHVPDKHYFHSMLEEEQEKELEPEQEQEEEIHRPSREVAVQPKLHEKVTSTVMEGSKVSTCEGIQELFNIFRGTTIDSVLQIYGTGESCFVSEDFIKTVEKSRRMEKTDSFLKTIRFVVSFRSGSTTTHLVLSQFEVNNLISVIRSGKCCPETKLHVFSGRWMDGQRLFFDDHRLQLPLGDKGASPGTEDTVAPLLIASGNLYFSSTKEEKAFAKYLGLALKPWSEEDEKAFECGFISNKGFISSFCFKRREGCTFVKDPIEMVLGILKMRNEIVRDCDHAIYLLTTCTSVPINKKD